MNKSRIRILVYKKYDYGTTYEPGGWNIYTNIENIIKGLSKYIKVYMF